MVLPKKPAPKIMSPSANPPQSRSQILATQAKMRAQAAANSAAQLQKVRDYYAKNGHVPTILANESRRYFQDANAKDVSALGQRVALGQMTMDQALASVRQGTSGINDLNKRAGLATALEIDPQELAIKNNLASLNQAYQTQATQSKATGEATVARQKAVYDALLKSIAAEPAAIAQNYGQTSQKVGQNYDAALASTQQNYANAEQANTNEAARLGLQAATPVAQGQMQGDAAFLQGLLQSQKMGEQGTLANLQQSDINSANQFGRMAGAESAGVQTATLGDFALRQQDALAEKLKQEQDYNSQNQQLEAGRAPKLYESLQGLYQSQQQAEQDAADRQFQQYIAQQTLGVKQTEAATHQYSAQTDRQKVEVAARKSDAELQKILRESQPGTLEYQTAQAAIDLKHAQAAATLTNAKTGVQNANTNATKVNAQIAQAAQTAKTQRYRGMPGVSQFLRDSGVDDKVYAMVMKHVNNTIVAHKAGDYPNGLRGVEGYIRAHKLNDQEANVFRIATAIAYGKS